MRWSITVTAVNGVTIPGVSPESQASEALPSRRRRTLRGGRHRGDESFLLPPGSPALVLAVPGSARDAGGVPEELARLVEIEHTGQPTLVGYLDGDDRNLGAVLAQTRQQRADEPAAVVVPLATGPDPAAEGAIRQVVSGAPVPALPTEPLGPHPLIAEALHDRLADAGLARADRIRMMTMVTAAGGVIVVVPGDAYAVRQAEVTGVLLASRLASPVFTARIDDPQGVQAAAAQLRGSGVQRLAVAPYLIGMEPDARHIANAAAAAGAEHAAPLGAHTALARLAALRYAETLASALSS
jgi:sirohydrochlorin ferrochelatase